MLLPRVGETRSTAQFIYLVFCQCPADGGDCVSQVNGNKNCMKNAMSRKISHVNVKKNQLIWAKKWWKGGWWQTLVMAGLWGIL